MKYLYTKDLKAVFFSLLFVFIATVVPAQEITLPESKATRLSVIQQVESQTGYGFVYDRHRFDETYIVNFRRKALPLSEVLDKLVSNSDNTYILDGRQVIIYADTKVKSKTTYNSDSGTPQKSVQAEPVENVIQAADTAQTIQQPHSEEEKTTAYFVPNTIADHTIKALSNEPNTAYNLIPFANNKEYLPKTAIKTNFLPYIVTAPNLAIEFGLARKWTLEAGVAFNPFQWQKYGMNSFWLVQPEVRYWFCQRFEKHFIGFHGLYGQFDIGNTSFPFTDAFKEHRYDGWGAGAGISYGYHLPMSKRWAWEFTIGAGYVYLEYDKYRCHDCDEFAGNKNRHYFGPTKAGVSLIFMIK